MFSQSNSPTNSFPQPPSLNIDLPGIWDATDCDTIYDEKITDLTDARDNAIKAALEKYADAIATATQTYRTAFQLENAMFNGSMAQADADFFARHSSRMHRVG